MDSTLDESKDYVKYHLFPISVMSIPDMLEVNIRENYWSEVNAVAWYIIIYYIHFLLIRKAFCLRVFS